MRRLAILVSLVLIAAAAALLAGRLTSVDDKVTATGVSRLDVQLSLAAGRFDIVPAKVQDGVLATYHGDYNENKFEYRQDFQQRGEKGEFTFESEMRGNNAGNIKGEENSWEFNFSPELEYSFDVEVGAAVTTFDLSNLSIADMRLDIGAAEAHIDFATPNKVMMRDLQIDAGACELEVDNLANARFELLTFDGGMGNFTLDFTGKFDYEAEAQISVGMGSVEIILPDDLAVRLEAEENWFNSIDIPKKRFHKVRGRDGIWETENWDEAKGRLTLILDIGMGSADIRFR